MTLSATQLVGFMGHADAGETEVAVAQAAGTVIGTMTARAGLAAAFDSTTAQTVAQSAASNAGTLWGTCGKDWGVGLTKKISYFKCYASSNGGFNDDGLDGMNIAITLRGSATDDSGSQDSGTLLHTIDNFNNAVDLTKEVLVVTTQTHFRFVWVQVVSTGGTQAVISEIEFKELV